MGGEETRFKIGNTDSLKWTEQEVSNVMFKMLENALNDPNILCLQDAILSVNLYSSSLNYLIKKYPVFESIKKDIADIIIARINGRALAGTFNATAAIWRFKQLGERDERSIDMTSTDGTMSPTSPKTLADWYNENRSKKE